MHPSSRSDHPILELNAAEIDPALAAALSKLNAGEFSPVIATKTGFYIVKKE
ncbi:MAG: peptidyl-prolyl cis-trans isomerase [Acidobacteriota bacterium]